MKTAFVVFGESEFFLAFGQWLEVRNCYSITPAVTAACLPRRGDCSSAVGMSGLRDAPSEYWVETRLSPRPQSVLPLRLESLHSVGRRSSMPPRGRTCPGTLNQEWL